MSTIANNIPFSPTHQGGSVVSTASNVAGSPQTSSLSSLRTDLVTTANASPQLKSLQAAVATAPDFDGAKVAAIKSAIADGSFKVDAGKVADSIIAHAGALL